MVRTARRAAVSVLVLFLSSAATAQLASLAADVNTTITIPESSEPHDFTRLGSRLVFAARAPSVERLDLWSTDGTVEGTVRLAEGVQYASTLAVLGEKILWAGFDPTRGTRIYVSGGTPGSTRHSSPEGLQVDVDTVRVVRGTAYLFLYSPEGVLSLWRTRGEPQLELVAELGGTLTPACSSYFSRPTRRITDSVATGGRLAFRIAEVDFDRCEDTHAELWFSDGTARGTRQMRRFDSPRRVSPVVGAGDRAFFVSDEGGVPRLWVSDGSAAGTVPIFEMGHGAGPVLFRLWSDGTRLLFPFDDGVHGIELWSVESRRTAPRRLTDLPAAAIFPDVPENPTVRLGNRLLVPASTPEPVGRLWVVTGDDPSTTRPLGTVCLGQCGADPSYLPPPLRIGPVSALFLGDDGGHGVEPWVTDGTDAGTHMVRDVCPGECTGAGFFVLDPPSPLFTGFDPTRGSELWMTDGTEAGTRPATSLPFHEPFGALYGERPVGRLGSRVVSSAWSPGRGFEPWISEGDPPWTRLLGDLAPGASSDGHPFGGVPFADELLFLACPAGYEALVVTDPAPPGFQVLTTEGLCDASGGGFGRFGQESGSGSAQLPDEVGPGSREAVLAVVEGTGFWSGRDLWRTDGTIEGTERLTNVAGTTAAGLVTGVVPFEGRVVFGFCGEPGLCRPELWSADPVSSEISPFGPSPELQGLGALWSLGDRLYFTALDDRGWEIWTSDGTDAGTYALTSRSNRDVFVDPGFVAVGNDVYFRADQVPYGNVGLWRTDGTPAGTSMLDLPSPSGAHPRAMVSFDGALYFVTDGEHGTGSLWRSDGTVTGTLRVADLGPQTPTDMEPRLLAGGFTFFTIGAEAETIWISDGTRDGTRPLEIFGPQTLLSFEPFVSTGDRLYFSACAGHQGCELWSSDGTPGTARLVHDLHPGSPSSSPRSLVQSASRLFFSADDGLFGRELWALPLAGDEEECVPNEREICLADRFRAELVWSPDGSTLHRARPAPLGPYAATFSFSNRDVPDGVLKVLDGTSLNDHHWLFYGGLSDRGSTLTVADAVSGRSKRYRNPEGAASSFGDAFAEAPGTIGLVSAKSDLLPADASLSCDTSPDALCLQGGRFAVTVERDGPGGSPSIPAPPVALGPEHGTFHFFRPDNPEVAAKILDGRHLDGHFWLFVGSLTDRGFTLTVTDVETGTTRTYRNPGGIVRSFVDRKW